jgi:enoyl-CoA hydratase/carnithine racemase
MDSTHVTIEVRGAALRIAMTRPEKKNALTLAMYEAMVAGFQRAASDDAIRCVILTGTPGVFTAGNDLVDFMKSPPTGPESPVLRFIKAVYEMDKPVIAAVDGAAVGLGTTILLHCDLVIATERAKFTMPFTKLGLVPEAASSLLVPAWFGRARAGEWLLLGRTFEGKDALAAGLVSRLVAPEELDPTADKLAAEIAALPREATMLTKRLIRGHTQKLVEATIQAEGDLFIERLRSPELAQAVMSFLSKKG